ARAKQTRRKAIRQLAIRRNRASSAMKGSGRSVARTKKQTNESLMSVALRMLARRSYSEVELRERLSTSRGAETSAVADCIARLKELGYLNDELFAHNYASYRVRLKPLGRAKLARELARKKVSAHAADAALDLVFGEGEEERLLDRAIARHIRMHGRPTDRAASKRLFDHLARRGFEYDLITRKLRELKSIEEDDQS
ncbi:MAG TPA: regulatory protein RecX, partial [Blastocatellia bacterium]|nr:regulatory protein RecX [Blastocatellia bacterium]